MPITIGTYPIEDVVAPNANGTAPIIDQPTAPLTDQPTAPLLDSGLPGYSSNKGSESKHFGILKVNRNSAVFFLELPIYEEAINMADGGGDGFRPKYPVFKRTTSYSSKN